MTAEQSLIVVAARLARAAPDSWDEFVRAHHAYEWDLAHRLVMSPPDAVYIAQGRAQGVAGVGRMLEDCRKTAEAMEANKVTK